MRTDLPLLYTHFAAQVHFLCRVFACSVTSWHRTEKRNRDKGGLADSFHLDGLAADLAPDDLSHRERIALAARAIGLDASIDAEHVHVELDYRRP
jgi:hypothetical protein